MGAEEIKVQDLYEGAYLLCRGFALRELEVRGTNGRRTVSFVIGGAGVQGADEEYRSGQAMANVAMLRFTLEKLKDRMFERLREGQ